jgi:drug/metabolite transporter (DMT)-like permease
MSSRVGNINDLFRGLRLKEMSASVLKTMSFTGLALIAFAANSVLCRLALGGETIDAASFTTIRLLSGVCVLLLILRLKKQADTQVKGSWRASLMLFIYAITFSYAYISLDTGTGALILFGSVQITMILISLLSGARLHTTEWLGMGAAFTGFVYLILPGVTAPSISGFLLMTCAGIAWGGYTLLGRGSENPLGDTAHNFLRTIPFVLVLVLLTVQSAHYTSEGILLAVISGGIASGIGYTLWYMALGGLSVTQAAVLQLSVPVIAALGGIIFVSEAVTTRLLMSSVLILGGILLVVLGRYYFVNRR